MKKRTAALLMALVMLAAAMPLTALAAGEGYAVIEQVSYPGRGEFYGGLLPTSDGGYAMGYGSATQGILRKYDAAGNLQWSTPLDNHIYSDNYGRMLDQTSDGGYIAGYVEKLRKISSTGAVAWNRTYSGYSFRGVTRFGTGSAALAYNNATTKVEVMLLDAAGDVSSARTLEALGVQGAASLYPFDMAAAGDGLVVLSSVIGVSNRYSIVRLGADGNLASSVTIDSARAIQAVRPMSDGRLLGIANDGIVMLDANGNKQWESAKTSGYITSAVQTPEGVMAVGRKQIHRVMPREDMVLYHDALIVRYNNSGQVIEEKLFYENMETLDCIIAIGGGKYMAVGSTLEIPGANGQNSALMRIGINTDPNFKPKTGWEKENGSWYYYINGNKVRGWQKVSGQWYFMGGNAAMITGWMQEDVANWYYLKSSGAMAAGWYKVDNNWYYMLSSGKRSTGWQKVGGYWYYMKDDGVMVTGWQKVNGVWYYLQSSGAMKTGWLHDGSAWYYLTGSGAMVTGKYTINGKVNNFAASGRWLG